MSAASQLTILLVRTSGGSSVTIPMEQTVLGNVQFGQRMRLEVNKDPDGRKTLFSTSRYEGDELLQSISGTIRSGSWINAYLHKRDPHHILLNGYAEFKMTEHGLEFVIGATGHPDHDEVSYYSQLEALQAETREADLRHAMGTVSAWITNQGSQREDGGDNDGGRGPCVVRTTGGDIVVQVDDVGTLSAAPLESNLASLPPGWRRIHEGQEVESLTRGSY